MRLPTATHQHQQPADAAAASPAMQAPGQSAEAVLLKYARISQATPDAPVYYTSRY
jgi:hypothetical protein